MFIVTSTYTRPNLQTPWLQQSDAFVQYVETNYRYTGKMLESSQSLSPDGLTFTRSVTWASRQDFLSFLADPEYITVMEGRDAYVAEHGIVVEIERRSVGEQLQNS